jgi:hypothetical protein
MRDTQIKCREQQAPGIFDRIDAAEVMPEPKGDEGKPDAASTTATILRLFIAVG